MLLLSNTDLLNDIDSTKYKVKKVTIKNRQEFYKCCLSDKFLFYQYDKEEIRNVLQFCFLFDGWGKTDLNLFNSSTQKEETPELSGYIFLLNKESKDELVTVLQQIGSETKQLEGFDEVFCKEYIKDYLDVNEFLESRNSTTEKDNSDSVGTIENDNSDWTINIFKNNGEGDEKEFEFIKPKKIIDPKLDSKLLKEDDNYFKSGLVEEE